MNTLTRTTVDRDTRHAVQLFMERIASRFEVVQGILFGSRARCSARPDSDADVAVVLKGTPGRFLPTKLAMADTAFDVLLETGIRVQPLPVWEDEWRHPENYPNPQLLHNIAREGVPL